MTQHLIDHSDIARNLADSIREIERELYQAQETAFDLERQRDAATSRARLYEYATWMLGAVALAQTVVLAGYM